MEEPRKGGVRHIGEVLRERNIVLEGFDPVASRGFTQVPNIVLEDEKLSPGAKLTYAMLLKYAWEKDFCFPGQETLAKDMGVGKRSVVRHIKELRENGWLDIKKMGLGRNNIYYLKAKATKKRE